MNTMGEDIIEIRKKYSEKRLANFREQFIENTKDLKKENLCIYTTGSYGRNEASEFSDLDLFFLNDSDTKFSQIEKTLIDAEIIKISRKMNLSEFSGDGMYLEIHNVNNFLDEIGSQNDDYENFFTARMLLLLEGKPINNEELFYKIIEETLKRYYEDFHNHEENFKATFLVNDIIRFWRTMCLNYEHKRKRKNKDNSSNEKNKVHIKNLKLKFSRKLTTYSFLISLLWEKEHSKETVLKIIKQTPIERLQSLSKNKEIEEEIKKAIDLYSWFIEKTQIEKSILIKWIDIKENRDLAFTKSRTFSKILFDIMMKVDNKDNLIYFMI